MTDPADDLATRLVEARHLQHVARGWNHEGGDVLVGRLEHRRPLVALLAAPLRRRRARQGHVTRWTGVLWVYRGQLRTASGDVVASALVSFLAPHHSRRPPDGLSARWMCGMVETRNRRLDERAQRDLEQHLAGSAAEFARFQKRWHARLGAVDAARHEWLLGHLTQPGLFGSPQVQTARALRETDAASHRPDCSGPTALSVTSELVLVGILTPPPAVPTP